MDVKIILSTQIISLLIKISTSQYYGNSYQQPYPQQTYPQQSYPQQSYSQQSYYQPQMQQSFQTPIQVHMPQHPPPRPQQSRQKPQLRPQSDDYSTDYDDKDEKTVRRGGVRYPRMGEEEDNISSEKISYADDSPPSGGMIPAPMPPMQPNLVLVPYPYALVVPTTTTAASTTVVTTTLETKKTTTTPRTTTITTTTTAKAATASAPPANRRLILEEPGLRYRARKTKPAWLPKYGIVPIPDKLAEKLMSQLRHVKALQARKNINREIASAYSGPLIGSFQ